MAKQTPAEVIDKLPTMDSFTVGSDLLKNVQTETEDPPEKEDPEEDPPVDPKNDAPTDPPKEGEEVHKHVEKEEDPPTDPVDPVEDPEEDPEKDPKDPKLEEDPGFWEQLETMTGQPVEVDWGDVSPESVEGAALREDAVRNQTQGEVFEWLRVNHRDVYEGLQFERQGGSIREMYNNAEPDYSKVEIAEDDIEAQKKFLISEYVARDMSPKAAQRAVEAAEDDQSIYQEVKQLIEKKKQTQEKERTVATKQREEREQMLKASDDQLIGGVSDLINAGKLNTFTIPKKDRAEFINWSLSNMRSDGQGGHNIIIPVDPKNLESQMQTLLFMQKGGDLGSIVQRAASTASTKKLKTAAQKAAEEKLATQEAEDEKTRDDKRKDPKDPSNLPNYDKFMAS